MLISWCPIQIPKSGVSCSNALAQFKERDKVWKLLVARSGWFLAPSWDLQVHCYRTTHHRFPGKWWWVMCVTSHCKLEIYRDSKEQLWLALRDQPNAELYYLLCHSQWPKYPHLLRQDGHMFGYLYAKLQQRDFLHLDQRSQWRKQHPLVQFSPVMHLIWGVRAIQMAVMNLPCCRIFLVSALVSMPEIPGIFSAAIQSWRDWTASKWL